MGVKTFTLRLNDEQHEFLEKKSQELGITKNDYIRGILDGEVRADKQEEILRELLEIKEMLKEQSQDD